MSFRLPFGVPAFACLADPVALLATLGAFLALDRGKRHLSSQVIAFSESRMRAVLPGKISIATSPRPSYPRIPKGWRCFTREQHARLAYGTWSMQLADDEYGNPQVASRGRGVGECQAGFSMVNRCEISRRFRRCGRPRVAVCQYCGRSFCGEHGDLLESGEEICNKTTCRKKKEDLIRHFTFKEAVASRNAERRCGEESCAAEAQNQCSKCRGLFCLSHLRERQVETRDGAVARASVCGHCHKRRKLWSQR